jgi:predicted dehydrogenase
LSRRKLSGIATREEAFMSSNNEGSGKRTRRDFLGQAAAAVLSSPLIAGAAKPASGQARPVRKASTRPLGANDRINLGFIGCGMQGTALMRNNFMRRQTAQHDFEFAAVCDVWEPRMKFGQEITKAEKTYRDFHDLLAREDIHAVVIAVPDHSHYPIAKLVLEAGKDVYLEKPMTYTIEEAAKLNDLVNQTKRVLQVGGSGPASTVLWKANEYIKAGKMGKILWALISYNRNTDTGMWDYPIPGVGDTPWPDAEVAPGQNLDWPMWLGNAKKRPFSAERYFRWRKFWNYSGGNATDLLYHQLGTMSTVLGFNFPTRAVGAGGVYVQKNREVPDTYITTVEYPGEYAVNMISCMGNQTSAPVTIYGNWGTLQLGAAPVMGDMGDRSRAQQAPANPVPSGGSRQGGRGGRGPTVIVRAERTFQKQFQEANDGKTEVTIEAEPGPDLASDWLECIRSRKSPVYNVLRGYQVMTAIKMGVDSYRQGRVMAFDPKTRRILAAPPPHPEYLPKDA